jgi:hypothetical protein
MGILIIGQMGRDRVIFAEQNVDPIIANIDRIRIDEVTKLYHMFSII